MKNSLFKRIAAVAFAAATILTCAPTSAMAAVPTINAKTDVSLTITKYVANEGDTENLGSTVTGKVDATVAPGRTPLSGVKFTALKVADLVQNVEVNGTNLNLAYKLTQEGATVLEATKGDAVTETFTANAVVTGTRLNSYIKDRKASEYVDVLKDKGITAITGENGVVTFKSNETSETDSAKKLPDGQGLYLIVETFAPESVVTRSHPFFVSLPMTDKENENDWQYDVYAYPKNSTATTNVDKVITEVNGENNNGIASGNHSAEAQIGDVITYQVPVTALIPDGGLTKLGITDTMSKGLTLKKEAEQVSTKDVLVYTGDSIIETNKVPETNYTVTAITAPDTGITTLTVSFTNDYLQELNAGHDKNPHFLFVYKATLNKNAILGQTGNDNTVKAEYGYTNNPNVEIGTATTKVYTWGIDLTKQGEDAKTKLQGVTFTLKKGADEMKFSTRPDDGAYVPSKDGSVTLTTNVDGKIIIRGLESGTYTLTETKTKDGYVLLKDPVTIEIEGDKRNGKATFTVASETVTPSKDGESNAAIVPVTVVNHKGFDLPATGGAGTTLFTIAGIVIVAVAGALLLMRRKTNK